MGNKKKGMKAVHDHDLKQLLDSLGLLDKLYRKELECFICGLEIELSNIGAISPIDGKICIICDNENCLELADNSERKR